jgi:hypothetical protein
MPTFEISRGGATYEVTAPDEAAAMRAVQQESGAADTSSSDVGAGLVRSGVKAAVGGFGVVPAVAGALDQPALGAGYKTGIDLLREQILPQGDVPNYRKVLDYLGIGPTKGGLDVLRETVVPGAAPERRIPGAPVGPAVEAAQEKAASLVAPAPTTSEGRIGEALATGAIEALGGSGMFKVAGRFFQSLPEAAAFFETMAAYPKTQAVYGAAASGGGEAAQELDLPPIVGTAAALATAAAGHTIGRTAKAAPAALRGKLDETLLHTPEAQEAAAAARLRGAVSDPDAVINRLTFGEHPEIVPGSKPTLYEATGDTGAGAAQRDAFTRDTGGYKAGIEERRTAQNEARVGEVKALGGEGNPLEIVDEFKRRRAALDADEDFKQTVARSEAETGAARAGTNAAPEEVGAAIRDPVEAARKATAAEGGKLYDQIAAQGVTAGTGKIKAAVSQHFKDIPESPLSGDERHFATLIKGYGRRLDFGALQSLRSEIAARARDFNSNDVTRRRYTLLKNSIDEAMDAGLERATQHPWLKSPVISAADDLTAQQRAANAHWRDYKQTYGDEPVLQRESTRSGFKMDEAAIPDTAFRPGNTGGERIRALKAQGATDASLVEAAALSLQQKAIKDGIVDPAAFRRWANNHAHALAELPDAARRGFQSAADASETLARVTRESQAARRGFDESAVGKILGVPPADLEKTIGTYLQTPSKAHELANAVSANPAAKAGLQRLTADYLLRQFTNASDDVSKASLTTFIKKNKAALAAVFGNEGALRWQRLSDDIERSRKQLTTGKDPAGPSTAADTASAIRSAAKESVLSVISSMFGPKGVIAHAALRGGKALVNSLKQAGIDNVDQLYARALLDPEVARKLLTRAPALKNVHFLKGLGTTILKSSALGAARGTP